MTFAADATDAGAAADAAAELPVALPAVFADFAVPPVLALAYADAGAGVGVFSAPAAWLLADVVVELIGGIA